LKGAKVDVTSRDQLHRSRIDYPTSGHLLTIVLPCTTCRSRGTQVEAQPIQHPATQTGDFEHFRCCYRRRLLPQVRSSLPEPWATAGQAPARTVVQNSSRSDRPGETSPCRTFRGTFGRRSVPGHLLHTNQRTLLSHRRDNSVNHLARLWRRPTIRVGMD
jgi:hypothetical protein